jgi:hypothetical protein
MMGNEIRQEVMKRRNDSHEFIKWWRREHDFMYFELLDEFLEKLTDEQEFEGFDLLDMEEMWSHLHSLDPEHLARERRTRGGEVIVWERPDREEADRIHTCPFTPKSLMAIFNAETRGMVIG